MKKVWCYTWSVPPCPDEALSGDSLSTETWSRSVSSRGEAWPHLSSVTCCRSRFPGSFPQLSSSLEYPIHVPVPAAGGCVLSPWTCGRMVPATCSELCSPAPELPVLGGSRDLWSTFRKRYRPCSLQLYHPPEKLILS